MSHQTSSSHVVYITIAIILVSKCIDGHEKSANLYVNRMEQLTDNKSVQLQQSQHSKSETYINSNPKNVQTSNHYSTYYNNNNHKIVFDRRDVHGTVNLQAPVTRMTISEGFVKFNETEHRYTGKANGEYEFR